MLHPSTLQFVSHFVRRYQAQTAILVAHLILSGLAEGVGVVSLLPLLELSMSGESAPVSPISAWLSRVLGAIGLTPRLEVLLGLIVLGMVLKGVFYLLAMRSVGYTVANVATDLRLNFIRTLLQTRWSYFTNQAAGRISNAVGTEAMRAASSYRALCALAAAAIQVLIYGIIAFLVSPQIALFAVLGGGLIIVCLGRLVEFGRRAGEVQTEFMRALIGRLTDALQGIKPIKAMGREAHLQPLLETETRGLNRALQQSVLAAEATKSAQEPLLAIMLAVALYFALTLGDRSFATVLVMSFLFYRLAGRVTLLQIEYQTMVSGESAFWSMQESIVAAAAQRETDVPSPSLSPVPTFEREIEFEEVSFGYGAHRVLDGVSLRIRAGAFVTLVGPSGAGKTTLVDLIVGLYPVASGRITVDGVPLSELDLAAWRRMIGYVPQEMFLFHDTVFQNVSLGDPEVTREAARAALHAAGAWEFVAKLPEEMDTVLGERGSRLSGGQRQRIAVARALARKPKLLILDEVTASLDPASEAVICEAIRRLGGSVTVVAISHQTAMIDAADTVYRVDRGRVTELQRTVKLVNSAG